MANYFPLIANTTASQIQEIPVGDFLDLSQSGIANSGNISVTGVISATGNITGDYILGNGSQLTGIDATSIQSGTSSVSVIASGGNIRANVAGSTVALLSASGLVVTGSIEATSGFIGLDASKISNGTSNVSVVASNGNVDVNVGGSAIVTFYSGGIDNRQANGVGNIGTATSVFNTVFAQATSAQYADVAERYLADQDLAPGTVVEIGGAAEVTATTQPVSTRVAGVISTQPALIMNSGAQGQHVVSVALLGRVPCRVLGPICKGDLVVSSDRPGVAMRLPSLQYQPGCVIGKALEDHTDTNEATIEIMVGRL
jgi:hypothetical protein